MTFSRDFFSLKLNLLRSFDTTYIYHQQVLTITFFSSFIALLYWVIFDSIKTPVALLATSFFAVAMLLSWAISREIHPSVEKQSVVILPIVALFYVFYGFPSLPLLGGVLLLMRGINHSVGKNATIVDLVGILALFSLALQSMKVPETLNYTVTAGTMLFFATFVSYIFQYPTSFLNDQGKAVSKKRAILATWIGGISLIAASFLTEENVSGLYVFSMLLLLPLLKKVMK